MKMWVSNKASLLFVISLALVSCSSAQNSPQDYVDAHNAARDKVGVGPLTWDNNLANYAQNYANTRRDCSLTHSDGPYGENIAAGDDSFTGVQAVNLWLTETQYYDHDSNSCSAPPDQSCGHYTQVVWRSSTKLGCGRVPCNSGGFFYICSYNPPGNIIGQSPY